MKQLKALFNILILISAVILIIKFIIEVIIHAPILAFLILVFITVGIIKKCIDNLN